MGQWGPAIAEREPIVEMQGRRGNLLRVPAAALIVLLASVAGGPARASDDAVADAIVEQLQAERGAAGVDGLERRDSLDRVAREHAEMVAGLPHARRLSHKDSLETGLKAAGVEHYRHAALHLDMNRGYTDPAGAFLDTWHGYSRAWTKAMDPRFDAIGLASARASDGWIILVAVLLEDSPGPPDLRELELRTVAAVNRVREEHELIPLAEREELREVALAHSRDMIDRGFFAHRSPEGRKPEHRVRAAGLRYRLVAENIQRNRGWDDPVEVAVDSWMKSRGHRKAILTPEFRETGVGVAAEEDGTIYFTQLFFLEAPPPPPEEPPAP